MTRNTLAMALALAMAMAMAMANNCFNLIQRSSVSQVEQMLD